MLKYIFINWKDYESLICDLMYVIIFILFSLERERTVQKALNTKYNKTKKKWCVGSSKRKILMATTNNTLKAYSSFSTNFMKIVDLNNYFNQKVCTPRIIQFRSLLKMFQTICIQCFSDLLHKDLIDR